MTASNSKETIPQGLDLFTQTLDHCV